MKAIEVAQRLAQLGATEDACRAYILALNESSGEDFSTEMEAAAYLLEFGKGEDYKVAYTYFQKLYNKGMFKETVLDIMTEAFYTPNMKLQKSRYEKNLKLLEKYPYIFRKDFPKFEDLPIRFYPFDDKGFIPFYPEEERFGDYIDYNNPVVSHNFFKNLDGPILATDVFSQYELEYLNDNVRKSEWVAKENHIYLHYTQWETFCAHLCVLNFRQLLADKKLVFLIEDEASQYPIDFKERFGIDYSQYTVKPVGIREINKVIWHTQLSSHNGGDFFNEIFDGHPNLLMLPSIMLSQFENAVKKINEAIRASSNRQEFVAQMSRWQNTRITEELYALKNRTDKDVLAAIFMQETCIKESTPASGKISGDSRITPAIFFQPHFPDIEYHLEFNPGNNDTTLCAESYEVIVRNPLLRGFKYIKTFTPMRRITTSYGATQKFKIEFSVDAEKPNVVTDSPFERVLNRSFMIDWQDRLFKDSRLVRFEDGKLNPKATFTALAAFLDIPYTESMTYCSNNGELDPESYAGNVRGFDPAAVYRTYDDYANDSERYFIEYFLRDAYEYYGYDFKYYDGSPMSESKAEKLVEEFTTNDKFMRETWIKVFAAEIGDVEGRIEITKTVKDGDGNEIVLSNRNIANYEEVKKTFMQSFSNPSEMLESYMAQVKEDRLRNVKILMRSMHFVNKNGQPLHMMPKLELDPGLLEQPLYH